MATKAPTRLELPDDGVLPDEWIRKSIEHGLVSSRSGEIPSTNIQPASLDLRLGPTAYRLQCSFLPDTLPVEEKLRDYMMDEVDISHGGILDRNQPYLIRLDEELHLTDEVRAKANPKSSTGRLDIFTRVITDNSYRFDEIRSEYSGCLYLEVVSRSFTVKVYQGMALNQLRFMTPDSARITDKALAKLHASEPLLFHDGVPIPDVAIADGLFMSLDLRAGETEGLGYKARRNSHLLDLSKLDYYNAEDFWEPVRPQKKSRVILEPEEFYLLLSWESIRIPPQYAAEMTAYDPTSGELRTHYAGFFDPGFGHEPSWGLPDGSRAALEIRAHDVSFMVEHGQRVCKLSFEQMMSEPFTRYGLDIGSNYQVQDKTLSKHFKSERPPLAGQMRLRLY